MFDTVRCPNPALFLNCLIVCWWLTSGMMAWMELGEAPVLEENWYEKAVPDHAHITEHLWQISKDYWKKRPEEIRFVNIHQVNNALAELWIPWKRLIISRKIKLIFLIIKANLSLSTCLSTYFLHWEGQRN